MDPPLTDDDDAIVSAKSSLDESTIDETDVFTTRQDTSADEYPDLSTGEKRELADCTRTMCHLGLHSAKDVREYYLDVHPDSARNNRRGKPSRSMNTKEFTTVQACFAKRSFCNAFDNEMRRVGAAGAPPTPTLPLTPPPPIRTEAITQPSIPAAPDFSEGLDASTGSKIRGRRSIRDPSRFSGSESFSRASSVPTSPASSRTSSAPTSPASSRALSIMDFPANDVHVSESPERRISLRSREVVNVAREDKLVHNVSDSPVRPLLETPLPRATRGNFNTGSSTSASAGVGAQVRDDGGDGSSTGTRHLGVALKLFNRNVWERFRPFPRNCMKGLNALVFFHHYHPDRSLDSCDVWFKSTRQTRALNWYCDYIENTYMNVQLVHDGDVSNIAKQAKRGVDFKRLRSHIRKVIDQYMTLEVTPESMRVRSELVLVANHPELDTLDWTHTQGSGFPIKNTFQRIQSASFIAGPRINNLIYSKVKEQDMLSCNSGLSGLNFVMTGDCRIDKEQKSSSSLIGFKSVSYHWETVTDIINRLGKEIYRSDFIPRSVESIKTLLTRQFTVQAAEMMNGETGLQVNLDFIPDLEWNGQGPNRDSFAMSEPFKVLHSSIPTSSTPTTPTTRAQPEAPLMSPPQYSANNVDVLASELDGGKNKEYDTDGNVAEDSEEEVEEEEVKWEVEEEDDEIHQQEDDLDDRDKNGNESLLTSEGSAASSGEESEESDEGKEGEEDNVGLEEENPEEKQITQRVQHEIERRLADLMKKEANWIQIRKLPNPTSPEYPVQIALAVRQSKMASGLLNAMVAESKKSNPNWQKRCDDTNGGAKQLMPHQLIFHAHAKHLANIIEADPVSWPKRVPRGTLVYYNTGAGKTAVACGIMDAFAGLIEHNDWKLYVVTTFENKRGNSLKVYAENMANYFPAFQPDGSGASLNADEKERAAVSFAMRTMARVGIARRERTKSGDFPTFMTYREFGNALGLGVGANFVHKIDLNNAVIIFDEAHNMAKGLDDEDEETLSISKEEVEDDAKATTKSGGRSSGKPSTKKKATPVKQTPISKLRDADNESTLIPLIAERLLSIPKYRDANSLLFLMTASPGNTLGQFGRLMRFLKTPSDNDKEPPSLNAGAETWANWLRGKVSFADISGVLTLFPEQEIKTVYLQMGAQQQRYFDKAVNDSAKSRTIESLLSVPGCNVLAGVHGTFKKREDIRQISVKIDSAIQFLLDYKNDKHLIYSKESRTQEAIKCALSNVTDAGLTWVDLDSLNIPFTQEGLETYAEEHPTQKIFMTRGDSRVKSVRPALMVIKQFPTNYKDAIKAQKAADEIVRLEEEKLAAEVEDFGDTGPKHKRRITSVAAKSAESNEKEAIELINSVRHKLFEKAKHGGPLQVMIVHGDNVEGLDLKGGVKFAHQLTSFTTHGRQIQFNGRIRRLKSHCVYDDRDDWKTFVIQHFIGFDNREAQIALTQIVRELEQIPLQRQTLDRQIQLILDEGPSAIHRHGGPTGLQKYVDEGYRLDSREAHLKTIKIEEEGKMKGVVLGKGAKKTLSQHDTNIQHESIKAFEPLSSLYKILQQSAFDCQVMLKLHQNNKDYTGMTCATPSHAT